MSGVSGWDKTPRSTAKTAAQKRDDRAFQIKVAVVGGLFGLGAAVIGAMAGVGGGYFIADRQVNAQIEQGQTEFLRNERRVAYGDLLKADAALIAVEQETFSYIDVDVLPEEYQQFRARLLAGVDALQAAQNVLEMVGSETCTQLGSELTTEHFGLVNNLLTVLGNNLATADSQPTDRERRDIRDRLSDKLGALRAASRDFVVSARDEFSTDA